MGKRKVQGHGTRACYIRLKCHCKPCLAANARYQAERRWRLGIYKPISDRELKPCGTPAAYRRGCHCKKCRRANTDDVLARRRRRKIREEWML